MEIKIVHKIYQRQNMETKTISGDNTETHLTKKKTSQGRVVGAVQACHPTKCACMTPLFMPKLVLMENWFP
jgi:hypothetical protein